MIEKLKPIKRGFIFGFFAHLCGHKIIGRFEGYLYEAYFWRNKFYFYKWFKEKEVPWPYGSKK